MVQMYTKEGDLVGEWDRRRGGVSDIKEGPSNYTGEMWLRVVYMILGEVNGTVALQWTNRKLTARVSARGGGRDERQAAKDGLQLQWKFLRLREIGTLYKNPSGRPHSKRDQIALRSGIKHP